VNILIVEDDAPIAQALEAQLPLHGFTVHRAETLAAAMECAEEQTFQAMILDLRLPDGDGLELLKEVRQRRPPLPTIITTARDALNDRVRGLNAGADDYLVKPFELTELAARIRALLRRSAGRADPVVAYGDIELLPVTREVRLRGEPVALSPREYAVLDALLARPGAILSRAQLEEKLYGWNEEVESNAIEVHIHALRRKLGADAIRNVRGVGWMIAKANAPDR